MNKNDFEKACAICEHSYFLSTTGSTLCKKKKSTRVVQPDDSCRHFSIDPLKLEPITRKKYVPEI